MIKLTDILSNICEEAIKTNNTSLDENLHKWFKEKWVRFGPDGKIRGDCARGDDNEGKPKCLPQDKAYTLGKKARATAASRKRKNDPNPNRSGKAINVPTTTEASSPAQQAAIAVSMKAAGKKPKHVDEMRCSECGGAAYNTLELAEKHDACYNKVRSRYKVWPSAYASGALVQCRKKGAKNWGTTTESVDTDKTTYHTVHVHDELNDGEYCMECMLEVLHGMHSNQLGEAEYHGRKVSLGKPFRTPGGPKKTSVYVKNQTGNVVKVNFGDPNMRIKKSIPARRRSFRARHHCDTNPGPRTKARYWSCRAW